MNKVGKLRFKGKSSVFVLMLCLLVSSFGIAVAADGGDNGKSHENGTGDGGRNEHGNGYGNRPAAQNIHVSGKAEVGQTLNGSYTFIDPNGDSEGISEYRWYISDDANGTEKTVIAGASGTSLKITESQLGKYISFEVTPFSTHGFTRGIPVESERTDPIKPDSTPPAPVAGLEVADLAVTSLKLAWSPSYDLVGTIGYRVDRSYNRYGIPVGTAVSVGTTADTALEIPGLLPGTEYTFSVSAYDGAGNYSEPASVKVTTPNASGLAWKSGYFSPTQADEGQLTAFENWRGRDSDISLLYIGGSYKNKWETIVGNPPALIQDGNLTKLTGNSRLAAFSIPLLAKESAGKFSELANGEFDRYHQQVADRMKEIIGDRPIYIRLGWEANRGYEWSYENNGGLAIAADYKQGWARIAKIYRKTIPNARMVWNNLRNITLPITAFYPGNDVVDVLGMDPYDNGANQLSDGKFADSESDWNVFSGSFNESTGMLSGPGGLLAYAKTLGKKISIEEWGPTNRTNPFEADGSNNSYYVQRMHRFFKDNADSIEFEIFFNGAQPTHQIFPVIPELEQASTGYLNAYHP